MRTREGPPIGEPIRKTAAQDDILQDFRTTQTNAAARGGLSASLADQRLLPILLIIDSLTAQKDAAEFVAGPLLALLAAVDRRADKRSGRSLTTSGTTSGGPLRMRRWTCCSPAETPSTSTAT
ncbi:MAG: hypothetical protein ABJE95_05715 [Byssovorax sp.]